MKPAEELAQIELARLLVRRLERLSADSLWARRASGARGALLKLLEEESLTGPPLEPSARQVYFARLQENMDWGFALIERAANELNWL